MTVKRNGIVDGFARNWPREMFDFKAKFAKKESFLEKPGVYVLYDNGKPHYIGQAVRMFDRLNSHAKPQSRNYNFWNTFSAFAVGDKKGRDELEAILISAMPTANAAKPKLNKMRMPPEVVALMRKIRDGRLKETGIKS
jgi:hypothetical protein